MLNIRGTHYPMPGEDGQPFATGEELIAIEEQFGLDALKLLSTLSEGAKPEAGYTRTKAIYATTWIAVHRVDPTVTLADHLRLPLTDLDLSEEENPTDAASSEAAPETE